MLLDVKPLGLVRGSAVVVISIDDLCVNFLGALDCSNECLRLDNVTI